MTETAAEAANAAPGDEAESGRGIPVPAAFGAVATFALSSLVAIISFLAIYVGALLLAVCIRGLNGLFGAADWLTFVAEAVERILVYVDMGLLLIFLVFEIMGYVRERWREFRDG
jgi:hypothetical protein